MRLGRTAGAGARSRAGIGRPSSGGAITDASPRAAAICHGAPVILRPQLLSTRTQPISCGRRASDGGRHRSRAEHGPPRPQTADRFGRGCTGGHQVVDHDRVAPSGRTRPGRTAPEPQPAAQVRRPLRRRRVRAWSRQPAPLREQRRRARTRYAVGAAAGGSPRQGAGRVEAALPHHGGGRGHRHQHHRRSVGEQPVAPAAAPRRPRAARPAAAVSLSACSLLVRADQSAQRRRRTGRRSPSAGTRPARGSGAVGRVRLSQHVARHPGHAPHHGVPQPGSRRRAAGRPRRPPSARGPSPESATLDRSADREICGRRSLSPG